MKRHRLPARPVENMKEYLHSPSRGRLGFPMEVTVEMRVVLASESRSRRRALDILGITYEVYPSEIEEKSIRDSDPAALTKKLAEAKAWKVASLFQDAVVVSGDAGGSERWKDL